MSRSDERADAARVLRDVRSTLAGVRKRCRQPNEIERQLQSLLNDIEGAEASVAYLPPVTSETVREIRNKLEVIARVLNIVEGHVSRRLKLTPAAYGIALLEFVSLLATKLDDAIDVIAEVERSLGTSALRRRTYPRTIDMPIRPDGRNTG